MVEHASPAAAATDPAADRPANRSANTAAPHETPGLRARMRQLLNTRAVLHPPALRYQEDWSQAVANICNDWVADQELRKRRAESPEASREISRMLALAHEFKNLETLRKDGTENLILGNVKNPKQVYTDAIIRSFLHAVGETDVEAVLNSFKNTGTGASHRQIPTVISTIANLLGAAQILAPDPIAKAAISGTRLAVQVGLSAAVIDSGERRLFNSGTEDALPLGRAEAATAARRAPSVLQASWDVMRELHDVEKDLRHLTEALKRLEQARANPSPQGSGSANGKSAAEAARDDVNLVSARICYKLKVKQGYKAARENAAVEWRGGERGIYCGTTGTALTLTAAGIGIMTPEIIASAISGGLLAGAATTALLLYIGYQLGSGPSKDGEAKARRAIIALAKLTEVLDPTLDKAIQERAAAYERYREDCKRPSRLQPARREAVEQAARRILLASLNGITQREREQGDAHPDGGASKAISPEENWAQYRTYQQHQADARTREAGADSDGMRHASPEASDDAAHPEPAFTPIAKPLIEGWKRQIEIKMIGAQRLLAGKVARAQKHVLAQQNAARPQEESQKLIDAKEELRQTMRNLIHFELAYSQMRVGEDGARPGEAVLDRAKALLLRIDDSDARALFCGDADQQVKATYLSKRLTAGETERYTLLNTGANALAMGLGIGLQAGDVHIAFDKADGAYTGPRFNDFKLVATLNGMPTPSGPLSTGDRAPFQQREMPTLLKTIEPAAAAGSPSIVPITLDAPRPADDARNDPVNALDAQINALVDQMASRQSVFDTLTLEIVAPPAGTGEAMPVSGSGTDTIRIDLTKTAAFHRVRYKNATSAQKARYIAREAAIAAKQTGSIYVGPLAQLAAKPRLNATRAFLNQARGQMATVRETLLTEAPTPPRAPTLPEFSWLKSSAPDPASDPISILPAPPDLPTDPVTISGFTSEVNDALAKMRSASD
ncbi:hypothetical protein [Noviherbaspirillum aerium]|uniref:hypothetical protein n=1 Tax=Noviherbaspirillum aerium TaxID=2588497 RepID=UPI00124D35B8|nr:hypothetical protein [Noviherbaspirillum aerium]